ncbi:helix-turn-helix domain-containing protein [Patescibacteria group bacterium]|nr:helix-turn-helix domain-containing protein [Patescibacteria group bacterium]
MNNKNGLTTAQAAKLLGVSPVTVRWKISKGYILATKIGRDWIIDSRQKIFRRGGRGKKNTRS